jgi:hypothetical protein
MLKCEQCSDKYVYRLKQDGDKWICDKCYSRPSSEGIYLQDKVMLGSYGLVSKRRIDEVNRRVILNYDKKTGNYDVGRRDNSGRIQEREPNYYK